MSTEQDAAKRRGGDAFQNVDKTLAVEKYEKQERERLELPERVSGDPSKYSAAEDGDDGK